MSSFYHGGVDGSTRDSRLEFNFSFSHLRPQPEAASADGLRIGTLNQAGIPFRCGCGTSTTYVYSRLRNENSGMPVTHSNPHSVVVVHEGIVWPTTRMRW